MQVRVNYDKYISICADSLVTCVYICFITILWDDRYSGVKLLLLTKLRYKCIYFFYIKIKFCIN